MRADADRHHHQVGRQGAAVVEPDRLDLAVAQDGAGVGAGQDLDAALLDRLLQEVGSVGIELSFHQGRHQMDDGGLHAA